MLGGPPGVKDKNAAAGRLIPGRRKKTAGGNPHPRRAYPQPQCVSKERRENAVGAARGQGQKKAPGAAPRRGLTLGCRGRCDNSPAQSHRPGGCPRSTKKPPACVRAGGWHHGGRREGATPAHCPVSAGRGRRLKRFRRMRRPWPAPAGRVSLAGLLAHGRGIVAPPDAVAAGDGRGQVAGVVRPPGEGAAAAVRGARKKRCDRPVTP
jgi:hypothetical protein